MGGDLLIVVVVLVATLLAVVLFLSPFVKYGLKGRLFGARITRTVGEVKGAGSMPVRGYTFASTAMKVHSLDGAPERAVGLEIVATGFGGRLVVPFSLSAAEAAKLLACLRAVVDAH